jgi:hypothetical protein
MSFLSHLGELAAEGAEEIIDIADEASKGQKLKQEFDIVKRNPRRKCFYCG